MASSLLRTWISFRNSVDLSLRNRLTWSPPAQERAGEKAPPDLREGRWIGRYGLGPARERMTGERWRRNLAVLEVLGETDRSPAFGRYLGTRGALSVLDIGSKNFDYVDAVHGFLSRHRGSRTVTLTGIEVDAHRRYTDLRTRRAWAEHYCAAVPGASYLAGDLQEHRGRYGLITWFFPFVSEYPLLRWGLPLGLFRPQDLFDHAAGLLEPGGVFVLLNLTEREAGLQEALVRASGLDYEDLGAVPGSFSPRAAEQRLSLAWKPVRAG